MKATGITRKVDELGRIVLPKELRNVMNINIKDPIEIFTENDSIVLRKYESKMACMVTGEISNKNISLCDGKINLSSEGAKVLLEELQRYMISQR